MQNRIWIELDRAKNAAHAKKQCDLANNMLERIVGGQPPAQFWSSNLSYRLTLDSSGTYLDLPDRGHWFNLDALGAAPREKKDGNKSNGA